MTASPAGQPQRLPPGWKWAKLGELARINPPRAPHSPHSPEMSTTFVPMASVSEDSGTIAWPETRTWSEVSKGYTYFEEGDVLFAKITPCMQNGKHAIASGLNNGFGFGTTEFHVVRPGQQVIADWVHRFLRQPEVLAEATRHFRGAVGQQRVPKEFLMNLPIPLPPLAEQKRIVAILNEQMAAVDRAKKAAAERLEAARALGEALVERVFDEVRDRKWPEIHLGGLGDIVSGITLGRKLRNDSMSSVRPYLRVANVKDGYLDLNELKEIAVSSEECAKYLLKKGDLLLTEGGDPDKLGRGLCLERRNPKLPTPKPYLQNSSSSGKNQSAICFSSSRVT